MIVYILTNRDLDDYILEAYPEFPLEKLTLSEKKSLCENIAAIITIDQSEAFEAAFENSVIFEKLTNKYMEEEI